VFKALRQSVALNDSFRPVWTSGSSLLAAAGEKTAILCPSKVPGEVRGGRIALSACFWGKRQMEQE